MRQSHLRAKALRDDESGWDLGALGDAESLEESSTAGADAAGDVLQVCAVRLSSDVRIDLHPIAFLFSMNRFEHGLRHSRSPSCRAYEQRRSMNFASLGLPGRLMFRWVVVYGITGTHPWSYVALPVFSTECQP